MKKRLFGSRLKIMNGQMKNYSDYRDYIEQSYIPIDVNSLPFFFDMRGMHEYAKQKLVPMTELT